MNTDYFALLEKTLHYTKEYLDNIEAMPAFPEKASLDDLKQFEEPLPVAATQAARVIEALHTLGSKGTTAQTGGRYFGFVNGGLLPVAHAAQWLIDTWNQNSALYLMSPVASKLEDLCERWLAELFGLSKDTAAGLVTGSSNAIICALAAARNHICAKQGYDIKQNGLKNAPPIKIVTSEQAHSTVWTALSLLGFGVSEIDTAPVDDWGKIKLDKLPPLDANTILIIQAGNVVGGAYDPINELCDLAKKADAWVHIDGAFGLWAGASDKQSHLVKGIEKADSFSVDAHKTLNAAYDCGIVLCRNRQALTNAMQASGSYIPYSEERDNMLYTTEMSRRARGVVLWATLKHLGKTGIAALIDNLCAQTEDFADKLQNKGFVIINKPVFNQFIFKCELPEKTRQVLEAVQKSGVCWCGSGNWQGKPVIRVSVCSHRTTTADIDKSVAAFEKAYSYFSN